MLRFWVIFGSWLRNNPVRLMRRVSFAYAPHCQLQIELRLQRHFNNLGVNFDRLEGRHSNSSIHEFILYPLFSIFEPHLWQTNIVLWWWRLLIIQPCFTIRIIILLTWWQTVKILSLVGRIYRVLWSCRVLLIHWNLVKFPSLLPPQIISTTRRFCIVLCLMTSF